MTGEAGFPGFQWIEMLYFYPYVTCIDKEKVSGQNKQECKTIALTGEKRSRPCSPVKTPVAVV